MQVFINFDDPERDELTIRMRAEGPGLIGDFRHTLLPGQSFMGYTFAELKALGPGQHSLSPKPGKRKK